MTHGASVKLGLIDADVPFRSALAAVIAQTSHLTLAWHYATVDEAARNPGRPDVIVLSPVKPKIDAADAVRQIARHFSGAAILVLSSFLDDATILETLRAGAAGYLVKNTPLAAIISGIDDAFAGRFPLSPGVARALADWFRERAGSDQLVRLSLRQREILRLLAQGIPNKQIAAQLGLAESTVRAHLRSAYGKLNARSRTDAAERFRSGS